PNPDEPVRQPTADRRSGQRTVENADQRDPNLYRRKETAGILLQLKRLFGAAYLLAGQYAQTAGPRRNHRQFRHGEQPVEQGQYGDEYDFKQQGAPPASAQTI